MNKLTRGHLPAAIDAPAHGERVDELARMRNVVVEHISSGALDASVDYLQEHDEWVAVLTGSAVLEIAGEACELSAGDWVVLPARVPHRLVHTAARTTWLAVHVHASEG